MDLIDATGPVDVDARLDALAARYAQAGRLGIKLLNMIGGRAENLLDRLPNAARDGLNDATRHALTQAMKAAHASRSVVPEGPEWLERAVGTAMGAVGGFGGLPTALAEVPVTTTLLLRIIQSEARHLGFDPSAASVQFDCVQVFASAGPLEADDGADLGFLSARVTLTGSGMQRLIARVAPRLATVLGHKLAAQTVPILGAAAGGAINYAYTGYYRDIAHVHFGLRRLAMEADVDVQELTNRLRSRLPASAMV